MDQMRSNVEGWLYQISEEVTRLVGMSEDDPEFGRDRTAVEDKS